MNLCLLSATEHQRLHKQGTKLSDEHKEKIRQSMLGNEKLIKSLTGKKRPLEVREKIRKSHTGLINPKNKTEFVEIRKAGDVYSYYENGLTANRLKRSKYYDKLVDWAKTNNMPLTLHEEEWYN